MKLATSVPLFICYVATMTVAYDGRSVMNQDASSTDSIENTITQLYDTIKTFQVTKPSNYSPPFDVEKKLGVFESNVHFNAHGSIFMGWVRRNIKVFDNNNFVTTWIMTCLIEANEHGKAPKPDAEMTSLAMKAIGEFHSKNFPTGSPIMTFWPQTYNTTTKTWKSTPANILGLIDQFNKSSSFINWIAKILEKIPGIGDIARLLAYLGNMFSHALAAFMIPPDFDDSYLNLGLGALLNQYKADLPQAYQQWRRSNKMPTEAIDAMKRYAYRPFSTDVNKNTIDTRSYFPLRGFLEKAKAEGRDVALVPTWIQNIDEIRTMYYKGVAMPFNVNNIDLTIAANALYGLSAALLQDIRDGRRPDAIRESWFDPDVQKIYANTTSLLQWMLANNFTGRPDLTMTYYPSRYDFYWFLSRSLFLLESYTATTGNNLPFPVMEDSRQSLIVMLRRNVTSYLLNASQSVEEGVYFDDFLGDGDTDIFGRKSVLGEDRIFSTSMAINTLIASWTSQQQDGKLKLVPGTPKQVMDTLHKAVSWLNANVLSGRYSASNAFFSGSMKGFQTNPYEYPGNFLQYLNGTKIPPNATNIGGSPLVYGMSGLMDKSQYEALMEKLRTPRQFHGYNSGKSTDVFPFWSSVPFTYSAAMLALSQFLNIMMP